jgi:hypothetical protein
MNDVTKEIQLLFPEGKEVTLKGKKFVVKPFGFGKFPKVLKLLNSIKVSDVEDTAIEQMAKEGKINRASISKIMVDNGDVVVDMCSLAISQPRDFFDDLPGDEGLDLAQAIIEVNVDFFVGRLQPKLLTVMSGLVESVGGVSSQGSSQPATA